MYIHQTETSLENLSGLSEADSFLEYNIFNWKIVI